MMADDVVIAVMGMTGVGKSTFIRTITGRDDIVIGHGLLSETSEIRAYPHNEGEVSYTLVDTPGFDDTLMTDDDITTKILKWLETSYRSGTKLNGIVYLHSICAPRLQGTALQNLQMFRDLCGNDTLKNVVLATTFWSEIDATTAETREAELKEDRRFWSRMISKGSRVMRLGLDRASALDVLHAVASNAKTTLLAQNEMINDGLKSNETSAARWTSSRIDHNEWYLELLRRRVQEENEGEEKLAKLRQEAEAKAKSIAKVREMAELQRQHLEQQRRKRILYYKSHRCRCRLVGKATCTSCGKRVARVSKVFYHCCFCGDGMFLHCSTCGKVCDSEEHPEMQRIKTYW